MQEQKCNKCGIIKNIELFPRRNKEIYRKTCKQCKKPKPEDKEKNKIKRQKYWQKNKNNPIFMAKHKEDGHKFRHTISGKYTSYRCDSNHRNINFDISKEEFAKFWNMPCSYCKCEIETIGLDRINNDIGYQVDNIQSCCRRCNQMKMDLSLDEFKDHIRKIYLFIGNKNAK